MLIDDMLDRLEALLAKPNFLPVEAYPDNPQNYKMTKPKGVLLVAYDKSRYGQNEGLGMVVQERIMTFNVTLMVKKLKNKEGANGYLDAIRAALTGETLDGDPEEASYVSRDPNVLVPVSENFLRHNEAKGLWTFQTKFEFKTTAVTSQSWKQHRL